MDNLLDQAPCGFLVFTDDGKIADINSTLLQLLGYEYDELHSHHIEKILSTAGRIFYQTHFFPLMKLHHKVEEVYLSLHSRSGMNIPVLVNAVRHLRDEQTFNDCVFVVMNRRNQYEEEILLAKKQAEEATRAKDEFLSHVSHELRTPLNAILGWAQILKTSNTADDQMIIRAIEVILRNTRTQAQLIEDILDFSRIISGKLKLEIQEADPGKIIEAAVDVVTPAANAKKINLQTRIDPHIQIAADPRRLQQILWNLLSNSVKFTPEGGEITISLSRRNSNVEISVSDTGKGIAPEFMPYIFDRFQQADNSPSRREGGLGLGLAITRHIVELHGGTIHAESDGENLGAAFTVSLPLVTARHKNQDSDVIKAEV